MANTQVQLRRGDTTENDNFIGAEGELVYDTEKKQLRIHDGMAMGGYTVDPLVAFQIPTEENGYTWYRKYASGWVEQGGILLATGATTTVVLATEMSSVNYSISVTQRLNRTGSDWNANAHVISSTITASQFGVRTGSTTDTNSIFWEVKGMAKVGE